MSILSPCHLVVEIKQVLPLQLGKWYLFTCQKNFKDIIYEKVNAETDYQGNLFSCLLNGQHKYHFINMHRN